MNKTLLIGASAMALLHAHSALAQSAAVQSGPRQSTVIGEIVVTAQKRAENVQDVPITMAAVSGQSLAAARVMDARTLQTLVPSLNYTSGSNYASPFLRGIGSPVQQPGAEPSVATFVDGVYVAASQGTVLDLLGIERVEVLSGPQGTLYGRNASGGAINIYTLTPSQTMEAAASATVGNYHRIETTGHVSGPVSDTLSVGLYAGGDRSHTFLHFPSTPNEPLVDWSWGVRGKAVWQPTDGIKITASIETLRQRTSDYSNRNVQPDSLGVAVGGTPTIRDDYVYSDTRSFVRPRTNAAVLREEFDVGFADLVGITGYRNLLSLTYASIDGTDSGLADVGGANFSRQFSQEVQLLSKPDSPIRWIAGLFYLQEHGGYGGLDIHSDILFAGAPFNTATTSGDERTKSYAAFAQATVPVTDALSLTLGGRLTKDQKTKPTQYTYFKLNGVVLPIPATAFPGTSRTWNNFSPKATLEYRVHDALFYASYSKGFKSGQFNLSVANDDSAVNPEHLTSYEVGFKSDLFDRRLRFNAASYYYDFKNLQVQVLDPSGGGVAAVLKNAAKAKAYGVEFSATAVPVDNLTLTASASLEHTEYTQFDNAPFFIFSPAGNSQVLGFSAKGNSLVRAPNVAGDAGGTYTVPLRSGGKVDLHADAYYNGGFYWDPAHQTKQQAYTLVNASATYTLPDERTSVQVWGSNIFNAHHFGDLGIAAPFGTYANDAEPATYGVTVNWKM